MKPITFELTTRDGDSFPTIPGHYLAWIDFDRPTVMWWSKHSTDWRRGAVLVHPKLWAGPLPAREVKS